MYIYPVKPDEIFHYGIKERSGRYPRGSGDRPRQRLEKSNNGKEKNPEVVKKAVEKYIEEDYRKRYDVGSKEYFGLSEDKLKKYVDEDTEKLLNYLDGDYSGKRFKNLPTDLLKLINEMEKKEIQHSAKGSEWEDHKYVKKIDGIYYYPVGYEDGRTIDSLKGGNNKSDSEKSDKKDTSDKSFQIEEVKKHFDQYLAKRGIDWRTLPKDEVDQMQRDIVKQLEGGKESGTSEKSIDELAKDVVSGKLGNGDERKALLGEKYSEVQKKVNDLLKGSFGNKKVSEVEVTEEVSEKVKKSTSKVSEMKVHSGVNLSEVLSVYKKKGGD